MSKASSTSSSKKKHNPKAPLKGRSILELAKTIQRADKQGKVIKTSPTIDEGLKPKRVSLEEGYYILAPEEVLTLLVPTQIVEGGKIHGIQREPKRAHIRRVAKAVQDGKLMPAIEIGLYNNAAWVVDGQQRGLAAVLARESIPALARKMTEDDMRQLFADQSKGMNVNPSVIILSASDPFSEYVQDAVTDPVHPWSPMVTHLQSSPTKMTPKQMFDVVGAYVTNTLGEHVSKRVQDGSYKFDRRTADELAVLFKAFGNKRTNPLAFRPIGIKAIAYASVLIIRRNGSRASDIRRWQTWMPRFPWADYAGIRSSKELGYLLVSHWNKRLGQENRIPIAEAL